LFAGTSATREVGTDLLVVSACAPAAGAIWAFVLGLRKRSRTAGEIRSGILFLRKRP
jgi:hypothetical protein